jgi:Fe-S-cluster containining protein
MLFSAEHSGASLDMNAKPNSTELPDAAAARVTCASCTACCCRLEVLLMGEDDVPARYTELDEWGGTVMARLDDGWCAALDRATMLCTIYERRPGVCREFEMGGSDCLTERALYVAK